MSQALERQLLTLKDGKPKKIRTLTVSREGDTYLIEGEILTLKDATKYLIDCGKTPGTDYSKIAFILMRGQKTISTHKVTNRKQHTDLIQKAKDLGCALYYGDVVECDGKFFVKQPLLIDWDSVPEVGEAKAIDRDSLICPFCDKTVQSVFGRSNHVKAKHPDRWQEYQKLLETTTESLQESVSLSCPYCNKPMTSTPGRTLHVKAKHSDKLEDYQKWLKQHGRN